MNRKSFITQQISKAFVVGTGGTGSYLAQGLAKLIAGYKLDVKITLVDPDFVEERNCSRQNFEYHEVGEPKAKALAFRLNQKYGTQFMAVCGRGEEEVADHRLYNRLIVTCVDSIAARLHYRKSSYWLDLGNGEETGQAIFGTTSDKARVKSVLQDWEESPTVGYLPNVYLAGSLAKQKDRKEVAACADHPFAEQGVFANEVAAQAGLLILHQLLIKRQVTTPQIYFNTARGQMAPAYITKGLFK
jgi:PRTRC genetic system ThiF family protein